MSKSNQGRNKNRSIIKNNAIEVLEPRQLLSGTAATSTFTDTFIPAASAAWDNHAGSWTAVNGQYYAQTAVNSPFATSELPYKVTDFTTTVTANNLTDGGIWIHNDGTNQNGIVLVLGGEGYGQGTRGGEAGTSLYWQVVVNGTGYVGGVLDQVLNAFTTGENYTITVTGTGDTYSAFINGSATAATTLTTAQFPSGQMGLYDDQPNIAAGGSGAPMTFSNYSLSYAGLPATLTPTVRGKLPASVIAGQPAPVRQTLTFANTTGAIFSGAETTQWFLDTGINLDANAIALTAPVSKTIKLKNNGHASVKLSLKSVPASVPAGTYYLIAETTDAGGSSVATAATTITVAAPVISLSSSLGAIQKIQAGDILTLTNHGNIADTAKFTQTVSFSTDAAGLNAAGLSVTTARPIRINPLKSAKLRVKASKAQLAALLPDTDYYLIVTENDSKGDIVTAVSPTPFFIGPVVLVR